MPSRITIEIDSNPVHGSTLVITVANPDISYSSTQAFTFINGVPVNSNQIQIGATAEDTLQNIYTNFQLAYPTLVVSIEYPFVYLDFPVPGDATVTTILNTTAGAITAGTELIDDIPVVVPEAFEIADFSIQIIDTYENELDLIVELTRQSAPKLVFDSGESILEPLMTSELKFDMRVPNAEDAHFKHLFTGDEKRFKVKLNAIDSDENIKLIWQGFLLADLYKEPYQNGNLFVEFSATDMIGTLKASYFKPWEYARKINIMRLFSEIMAQTGLSQKFVVMPAMVPQSALIPWYYLNLELNTYFDGKKGENLYDLLSSVLQSNLLTLRSFEGYWYIEGVNRKFEKTGIAMLFDQAGVFESNLEFTRKEQQFDFVKGTLNFGIKSPLKEVFINYTGKSSDNLFPDDLVDRDAYFGIMTNNEWDETSQTTSYLDYWLKVGALNLVFKDQHRFSFGTLGGNIGDAYVVSENDALNNYFKSKIKPYLHKNKKYRIKIDVEFFGLFFPLASANWIINTGIPGGHFDNFLLYRLMLNGVEVLSNRQGVNYRLENDFFISYKSKKDVNVQVLSYVLDTTFELDTDGFAELQFLSPVSNSAYGVGLASGRLMSNFQLDVKKIELIPENGLDLNLIASRDLNFSNKYELDVDLVSSAEISQGPNFGLGIQLLPYQQNVPVATQVYVENLHTFNSTNSINKIFSWRFQISSQVENILFKQLKKQSLFITRENGNQDFFNSVYTNRITLASLKYLYYLTDRYGNPKIPSDYSYLPKIEAGDELTILLSNYPEEDLNQRLFWKIYNESSIQNFVETLAKIIHQMHPDNYYAVEGTLLGLYFPGEVTSFYYDNEPRDFVASRIEIDLFNSKTTITGREVKYEVLTDISYE
jgi:hypothetical protein